MLPFTPEELAEAVTQGRVTERWHPTLPLRILNYSPEVAFSNHWDAVTLNCRGLILDNYFNVVARPWAKFFNMGQMPNEIDFDGPVEVTDKLDGSLGILYPDGNGYSISTRGSFESKQAIKASYIWRKNYEAYYDDPAEQSYMNDYTFLFEIIYPSNRIVVNYGDMEDLVLLGAVEKEHGYYLGPREASGMICWPGPVTEVFEFKNFGDALSNWPHREGKEGVVVRSGDKMVKFKQPDYLELHKLVTNANPKTVWEKLAAGMSKGEIVSLFPDEFHDYIGAMVDPLVNKFNERLAEINIGFYKTLDDFMSRGDDFNRGGFARYIKDSGDKRYYFLLLDNRPISSVLWAELKPKETK